MITFALPHALLLLVPTAILVYRYADAPGARRWLRVLVLLLLIFALARPSAHLPGAGADLVAVVDLSRSMPPQATGAAQELIRQIDRDKGAADRLGVVVFGREATVAQAPADPGRFAALSAPVDPEGSALSDALVLAGELLSAARAGRVIVFSDGKASGGDARLAAQHLASRAIPIDTVWLGRDDAALDVGVSSLDLPGAVASGEPFRFSARLFASTPVTAALTLTRDGATLVKTTQDLTHGDNLVTFEDVLSAPGVASYALALETPGDEVRENDVGTAAVYAGGEPRVLVLSRAGGAGLLAQTLVAAGLKVETRAPAELSMTALADVRAVALDNVPAQSLRESGLRVLAHYVRTAGGGLVMTGGRRSFGMGGYHLSPLDELLPVSMEMKREQRRASLAMAFSLDRSGSMTVPTPDGRTKMQLATAGALAALDLLSEDDEASLQVVDTTVHTLFDLRPLRDGIPRGEVASVQGGGGGIFVGVALRAARDEILKSTATTRHVVLFSDAADSEMPDDYETTLAELGKNGVTVSVIGLGRTTDRDATLLVNIARLSKGRIHFVEDALSLPRVFGQEAIEVARSSFVTAETPIRAARDRALLGKVWPSPEAKIGGYNITHLRPEANLAARTDTDKPAPVLAFWQRGAGRVAAYTGEIDGSATGAIRAWPGYRALIEQMVRWVLPPGDPQALRAVARSRRDGHRLTVTVDFARGGVPAVRAPALHVLDDQGNRPPASMSMTWESERRLVASYLLPGPGAYFPVVDLDGVLQKPPPVTLAYSPEAQPGRAAAGRALMATLASTSGGRVRLGVGGLFDDLARTGQVRLAPFLMGAALGLLLVEVLARRLFASPRAATEHTQVAEPRTAAATPSPIAAAKEPIAPLTAAPERKPDPLADAMARARDKAKQKLQR